MRVSFYVQRRLVVAILATAAMAFPLGVLASHTFSDVPTSSTFHADIDAIADVGVTTGCGVNLYCPKDYVTREQMAAFLNRLGALAPGKTPVVNADKVDGLDASGVNRFAYATETDTIAIPDTPTSVIYGTVQITAPTSGYVLVNSSVTVTNAGCTANCEVYGWVRHTNTDNESIRSLTSVVYEYDTISTATVFDVAAGVNTFSIRITRDASGNGVISGFWSELTAQFSPYSEGTPARTPARTKSGATVN